MLLDFCEFLSVYLRCTQKWFFPVLFAQGFSNCSIYEIPILIRISLLFWDRTRSLNYSIQILFYFFVWCIVSRYLQWIVIEIAINRINIDFNIWAGLGLKVYCRRCSMRAGIANFLRRTDRPDLFSKVPLQTLSRWKNLMLELNKYEEQGDRPKLTN